MLFLRYVSAARSRGKEDLGERTGSADAALAAAGCGGVRRPREGRGSRPGGGAAGGGGASAAAPGWDGIGVKSNGRWRAKQNGRVLPGLCDGLEMK